MKPFLEYLYRSGKIAPAALAKAQVAQLAKMRSCLEIVHAENLLPASSLIEALLLQEAKSITFMEACRERGEWSESVAHAVAAAQAKERAPLLDLLAAQGAASRAELEGLFVAFQDQEPAPAPDAAPIVTVAAIEATAPAIEAPSASLAPAFPLTGDSLIDESILTAWSNLSGAPDAEACVHAFHRLKGALRFRGPAPAERWADFGEQAFRLCGPLGAAVLEECRLAGMDALRAVAAEVNPAAPRLASSQKEGLVALLQKLRQETDRRKKDAA